MARFPPRAARGRLALALWTGILAVLLVFVVTWVAGEIAERRERDAVDTRLANNLRVGREEFADTLAEAQARAERLAASERLQRALAEGNRVEAVRIAEAQEDVGLLADGQL